MAFLTESKLTIFLPTIFSRPLNNSLTTSNPKFNPTLPGCLKNQKEINTFAKSCLLKHKGLEFLEKETLSFPQIFLSPEKSFATLLCFFRVSFSHYVPMSQKRAKKLSELLVWIFAFSYSWSVIVDAILGDADRSIQCE